MRTTSSTSCTGLLWRWMKITLVKFSGQYIGVLAIQIIYKTFQRSSQESDLFWWRYLSCFFRSWKQEALPSQYYCTLTDKKGSQWDVGVSQGRQWMRIYQCNIRTGRHRGHFAHLPSCQIQAHRETDRHDDVTLAFIQILRTYFKLAHQAPSERSLVCYVLGTGQTTCVL